MPSWTNQRWRALPGQQRFREATIGCIKVLLASGDHPQKYCGKSEPMANILFVGLVSCEQLPPQKNTGSSITPYTKRVWNSTHLVHLVRTITSLIFTKARDAVPPIKQSKLAETRLDPSPPSASIKPKQPKTNDACKETPKRCWGQYSVFFMWRA